MYRNVSALTVITVSRQFTQDMNKIIIRVGRLDPNHEFEMASYYSLRVALNLCSAIVKATAHVCSHD